MKEIKKKDGKISDVVALELRRLGVVLEHVDGKVSLVAEQYGDIQKDIGVIRKNLDTQTRMLGKLTLDVEIVKEDIEFIKSGFKKKVDLDEFTMLERRVSLLEKRR